MDRMPQWMRLSRGTAPRERALHKSRSNDMGKLLTFTLAIVVCLGTTATLASHDRAVRLSQKANAPLAADAAFRDGLYVGKLAAEAGRPLHAPAGRWSSDADRASFVAGFQRGYNETLASLISGGQNRRD